MQQGTQVKTNMDSFAAASYHSRGKLHRKLAATQTQSQQDRTTMWVKQAGENPASFTF